MVGAQFSSETGCNTPDRGAAALPAVSAERLADKS